MRKARKKPASRLTKKKKPCVLFTIETLSMVQKSLTLFEKGLKQAPESYLKATFARETLTSLKEKLRTLVDEYDPTRKIAFDYNEVAILYGSLQIYSIAELELAAPSPQMDRQLRQCQALITYFHTLLLLQHIKKS